MPKKHLRTLRGFLVGFYAMAKRCGFLSSELERALYSRAYFLYKRHSEARQEEIIRRFARPGTVAVDVGANIGYFTTVMAEAVGQTGAVLAFEPEEVNMRLLRAAIRRAGLSNTVLVPAALGERNGRVALFLNLYNPADHRIYRFNGQAHVREVEMMTLDHYLDMQRETRPVSFIKIDVQGAELQVLRGIQGTLARYPKVHLLLEFDPAMLRAGGTDTREVAAFLCEMGFTPFLLGRSKTIQPSSWEAVEARAKTEGYIDVVLSREPILELTTAEPHAVTDVL